MNGATWQTGDRADSPGATLNANWELVFLARHGETEWNVQGRRQGQLDSPLTARGLAQARRHGGLLSAHALDAVFTSPLGRARATASIIAERVNAPVLVVDDLAEVHHGEFAGLCTAEISARHADSWDRRASDKYRWRFPGGESYADADERAGRALAAITAHPARRPVLVSHEMISRMLQRHLLRLDAAEALSRRHPNDVVYAINPSAGDLREMRSPAAVRSWRTRT